MQQLKKLVNEQLAPYQKDFDEIKRNNERIDEFEYGIKDREFYDYWPLQSHRDNFNFFKEKRKIEKDKIMMLYAIQRLLDYEERIREKGIKNEYDLYIMIDVGKDFFDQNDIIWPTISFGMNRHIVGNYNNENWILKKSQSDSKNYIEKIMKECEVFRYFNIFRYESMDENIKEESVLIDLKVAENRNHIHLSTVH